MYSNLMNFHREGVQFMVDNAVTKRHVGDWKCMGWHHFMLSRHENTARQAPCASS